MGYYKDETGNQYGKLTVLECTGMVNSHALWLCQCSCGQETIVRGDRLRGKDTLSCGCMRGRTCSDPRYPNAALNSVWYSYQRRAKARGRVWQLTKEEFVALTSSPCHYCGIQPSTTRHRRAWTYVYNGIDRVDNKLGYILSNVVPCCLQCNYTKRSIKYDEFVNWLRQAAKYQSSLA